MNKEKLSEAVQQITGEHVELEYVDQGYTGEASRQAAASHGIQLAVVKHTQAKRGFVFLPLSLGDRSSLAWARASDASPATFLCADQRFVDSPVTQ